MQSTQEGSVISPVAALARPDTPVWVQRPYKLDEIDVYWVPKDKWASGYNIYRSLNPMPFPQMEKRNTSLVTIPFFRDTILAEDMIKLPNYYYVVAEVMGDGSEIPLGKYPVSLQSFFWHNARRHPTISLPRIYEEMIGRKYFMLRNNAEVVTFLIRKIAGVRCECYNEAYESSPICFRCYGTSYVGGYDPLRDAYLRIEPTQLRYQASAYGVAFKITPTAWLADWPVLRNGDVAVRANGERFTIGQLQILIHQGVLTEQTMELSFIDPSHPIYNYEVGNVPVTELPPATECPY